MNGKCDRCGEHKKIYATVDGGHRCADCNTAEMERRLSVVSHGGKNYVARRGE